MTEPVPSGSRAAVVTCSNRSAAGDRPDDSGRILAEGLAGLGFAVDGPVVVPDEVEAIRAAIRAAVDSGAALVVTTGGTGVTPTDVTPEATRPLLDLEIPGLAETVRGYARDRVPTSILSRGLAGLIGSALVVNLPGSPGGARDGLAVLEPVVGHILSQARGGITVLDGAIDVADGVAEMVTVTDQPLSERAHRDAVDRPEAGAIVLFSGVVRDHDHGRPVLQLDYLAHPSAEVVLSEVAEEVAAEPRIHAVAVSHRVGSLRVGDAALVAAVSAAHRGEAFAALERLVDEVKARLPVWKHQFFADGSDEWVNCP